MGDCERQVQTRVWKETGKHTICKQQSGENTPLLQIIETDEKVKKKLTLFKAQTGG